MAKIGPKPDFLTPNICIYSESSDFFLFSGLGGFSKNPIFSKFFEFPRRKGGGFHDVRGGVRKGGLVFLEPPDCCGQKSVCQRFSVKTA